MPSCLTSPLGRLLFTLLLAGAVVLHGQPACAAAENESLPFGNNLFQGNFAKNSADVALMAGDRLEVRLWGDTKLDGVFIVEPDGSLNLPDIGSLHVAGLSAEQLEKALKSKLQSLGLANVNLYAAHIDNRPLNLMVTGFVPRPGSYQGRSTDTVLAFLDRAGGIDSARGSYRKVRLLRGGQTLATFDLYPFVLKGQLPQVRLQDGDTLVVEEKGPTVTAAGEVRNAARFEFTQKDPLGAALADLADTQPKTTHVSVSGVRKGVPYNSYLPLREFRALRLENGDKVRFLADNQGDTIMVEAQGAIRGASRFPVRRNARLKDIQQFIAVDPDRANLKGLYIKRKSVAEQQRKAIDEALRRLEQNAYTATSASAEEAQIRGKEAEMISAFVAKAREAQPDGIVVVGGGGNVADLALEDGDVIVIPEKSDVVLVSGEVMMPQAIVWNRDRSIQDYIDSSGGFNNRADTSNLLLVRPNGEVRSKPDKVLPGDHLMVLPRVESKTMQNVKDFAQVIYQVAVACKFILPI